MANNQFPPPKTPYTLKEIVAQILNTKGYAEFIHEQVCKARGGDATAKKTVDLHFKPDPAGELAPMNFSQPQQDQLAAACTDPKTHLIAFAGDIHLP